MKPIFGISTGNNIKESGHEEESVMEKESNPRNPHFKRWREVTKTHDKNRCVREKIMKILKQQKKSYLFKIQINRMKNKFNTLNQWLTCVQIINIIYEHYRFIRKVKDNVADKKITVLQKKEQIRYVRTREVKRHSWPTLPENRVTGVYFGAQVGLFTRSLFRTCDSSTTVFLLQSIWLFISYTNYFNINLTDNGFNAALWGNSPILSIK